MVYYYCSFLRKGEKSLSDYAIGVIKKEGAKWCLHFSNGRKECFGSKSRAEKRERQVQFFKHQAKGTLESRAINKEMANLGISAQYAIDGADEAIYVTVDSDGEYSFVLAKGPQGVDREVYLIDDELLQKEEFTKYLPIIESIAQEDEESTHDVELSEAIVGEQLIKGSHTHKATLDMNNDGKSTKDHDHHHEIYNGYVGHAKMIVNGIEIGHSHLRIVRTEGDS
jgi:hypothetical protein